MEQRDIKKELEEAFNSAFKHYAERNLPSPAEAQEALKAFAWHWFEMGAIRASADILDDVMELANEIQRQHRWFHN